MAECAEDGKSPSPGVKLLRRGEELPSVEDTAQQAMQQVTTSGAEAPMIGEPSNAEEDLVPPGMGRGGVGGRHHRASRGGGTADWSHSRL